jgi:hypothetical protein
LLEQDDDEFLIIDYRSSVTTQKAALISFSDEVGDKPPELQSSRAFGFPVE